MNISKLFENFLKEILGNIPEALIGEYLLYFIIFGGAFLFSVFAVCMVLCGKGGFFKLKSKEESKSFLFGAIAVATITGFFAYDNFHKMEVEKTRTERSQEFQHHQAAEYFVGTSDATGRDCYVVNESIHWTNRYDCHVTLKMVRPSDGNVQLLNYTFMIMQHWVDFENSQGFKDRLSQNYPIEWNMWEYIMKYSEQTGLRRP